MRKSAVALVLISALALTGCSGSSTGASGKEETPSSQIKVDEGLLEVTLTIPASLAEMGGKQTQAKVDASTKEAGYISGVLNKDGSVTYKMTKAKHDEQMAQFSESIDKSIKEAISTEKSIKAVTHNDDFTSVTLEVDKTAFKNSFTGKFAAFGIAINCSFYQLFNGADPDSYNVKIIYKDAATGEEFDSEEYPKK